MSTRTTIFATIFLIAFALTFSISIYDKLPEQMASPWNTFNQGDGYTSRVWGAFLMPVISATMLVLFLIIPQIDPLKENIAQFREYFNAFIALIVVFMVYMHILTTLWNLGIDQFNMGTAMLPAMGLLFIFAGVMMRKAKRNFFIGIRTPWTLSSDRVWDETHRIGSILFIGSGILSLLGAFFAEYAVWFILIPVLGSTLFLLVYSYVLYQQEEKA